MMNLLRQSARASTQRRFFGGGGHGHEAKHYEGIEGKIRHYLPEDYQIVLATIGGYIGFFGLYSLLKGKPKVVAVEESSTQHVESTKDDVPSMLSEKFDKWSKQPGNMAKWEKSLVKWEKQMEDPKYAASYTKSISM